MVSKSTKSAVADATAGVVGSVVAMLAFYPVDVIKTNLQASTSNTMVTTKSTLGESSQRPLSYYFRGLHFKISHTVASSFAYFFLYSWIQSTHQNISRAIEMVHPSKPYKYRPRTSTRLLLAAVAAMMNTFLTLPLDVLSARSQSRENKDATNDTTIINHDSILSLTNYRNWKLLWKGLWPSLLLCSNPSIHYTVFDLIKAKVLKKKRQNKTDPRLSWAEAFLFGMMAKFVATIATYPLIRAKVLLMVNKNNPTKVIQNRETNDVKDLNDEAAQKTIGKKESIDEVASEQIRKITLTQILVSTYKKEGVQGLYRGCNLQLLHTLLKSALLMMVRERITAKTRNIMLGGSAMDRTNLKD